LQSALPGTSDPNTAKCLNSNAAQFHPRLLISGTKYALALQRLGGSVVMATINSVRAQQKSQTVDPQLLAHLPESITLLELVYAINAITPDEKIVIDTVITMLGEGRVKLRGTFRESPISEFKS
jgi:hypothetical protein